MTMVFTDLVGSTRLKEELGNSEAVRLILEHHALVRGLLREYADGFEISTAGDSFFLAFRRPSDAVAFALRLQGRVRRWNRGQRAKLLDRVGIHTGEVTVEEDGAGRIHDLHGLEVDKCARVMSLGREHHILLTRFAYENARSSLKGVTIPEVGSVEWVSHGRYELKGVAEPMEICEVAESGRTGLEAPEDSEKAKRVWFEEGGVEGPEVTEGLRWWEGWSWRRIGRTGWVGMVVVVLAGWVGLAVPGLVLGSYDRAYWLRPVRTPSEVVVVQMDSKSHDELKQPWMGRWDWTIHAGFIDRMREFGAKAVVFDLVFDDAQTNRPGQASALVEAARKATNVCVAGIRRDVEREGLSFVENLGPFPELEAVVRWGISWFPTRVDDIVRHPNLGNEQKEGLASAVTRLLGKEPPRPGTDLWMNYYGPVSTIGWCSYSDVMLGRTQAPFFAGKAVFVGVVYDMTFTGGAKLDQIPTPYTKYDGRRLSGVEVLATSTLNFLRGESLRRTPLGLEQILILGVGGVFGMGLLRWRWWLAMAVVLAAGLVVAFLGMTTVWTTGVWFPWMVFSCAQMPVALAWLAGARWVSVRRGPRRTSATPRNEGQHVAAERRDGEAREGRKATSAIGGRAVDSAAGGRAEGAAGAEVKVADYQLIRAIGRGAYGTVWLARDAVGNLRALKVVERKSFREARPYEREFEGIRHFMPLSLEHPGLIRVFHVGRDDRAGFFHYVMEAADDVKGGVPVESAKEMDYEPRTLEAELKGRGAMGAREALALGLSLGEALGFLHDRQLIHRDIKPANVLYVRGQPKLGDIGLVTAMADADGRVSFLGTQGFMAPEGPGSASADLYSLGKLLYVAAVGLEVDRFPCLPDDLDRRADRALLLALNEVWLKACEPDVARRLTKVEEWLDALRRISETGHGGGTP